MIGKPSRPMQIRVSRSESGISRTMSEGTATAVSTPASPLATGLARAVLTMRRN